MEYVYVGVSDTWNMYMWPVSDTFEILIEAGSDVICNLWSSNPSTMTCHQVSDTLNMYMWPVSDTWNMYMWPVSDTWNMYMCPVSDTFKVLI